MTTTRIYAGRYQVTLADGRSFYVTRNAEARPTYWAVERADTWSPEHFAADTLGGAKTAIQAMEV